MAPTPQALADIYGRLQGIASSGESMQMRKDKLANALKDMTDAGINTNGITQDSIAGIRTTTSLLDITETLSSIIQPSPPAGMGSSMLGRANANGGRKKKMTRRRKTRKGRKGRKATRRS